MCNPRNKQYYEPDSYRIDSCRLPGSVYRDIKYDGGLFCNLICDDKPTMEEKFPLRTRVERLDPSTNMLLAGTVMDIPFPDDLSLDTAPSYTILFNNDTSMSIPLLEMADIIPKTTVDIATSDSQDSLLPPFLRLNSKITYEHDKTYHKGYLQDGMYWFAFKSHVSKRKEDWGINLPNLPTTWVDMCIKARLCIPAGISRIPWNPQEPGFQKKRSYIRSFFVGTSRKSWTDC
jgi:hypothetical protein